MKTAKTFKTNWNKLIKRQSNFIKKSLFIGITAVSISVLSGCQDRMSSIEPKSSDYSHPVNEITFKLEPAQLASKVTLNEEDDKDTFRSNYNDTVSTITSGNMQKFQMENITILESSMNKESWKETYEGKGIPLFRITF